MDFKMKKQQQWNKSARETNTIWHHLHVQFKKTQQTSEYNSKISSLTAKSLQMVTAVMKLKDTCSLEEKLWPT